MPSGNEIAFGVRDFILLECGIFRMPRVDCLRFNLLFRSFHLFHFRQRRRKAWARRRKDADSDDEKVFGRLTRTSARLLSNATLRFPPMPAQGCDLKNGPMTSDDRFHLGRRAQGGSPAVMPLTVRQAQHHLVKVAALSHRRSKSFPAQTVGSNLAFISL